MPQGLKFNTLAAHNVLQCAVPRGAVQKIVENFHSAHFNGCSYKKDTKVNVERNQHPVEELE